MSEDITTNELCDRYENLYPGVVADVLDDRGYTDQILQPGINPVQDDITVAGIAYPCRGRPNSGVDPESNFENMLKMLRDAPENGIVTYETNATKSSQMGELFTECMIARGCRGAVLDGGVRDISFIRESEFPVFTKFSSPADSVIRWELLEWGSPAVVGGVEVRPGDIVIGDPDGVTIVPEEIRKEVLEEAESLADTEESIRTDIRSGRDPVKIFEEHGDL